MFRERWRKHGRNVSLTCCQTLSPRSQHFEGQPWLSGSQVPVPVTCVCHAALAGACLAMIPLALSSTPGLWQGLNSVFLAGMVVDNSLQAGQLNVLAGRRGATKLAAVLHCFTPALISEIVELGRSHDIWDNSMAPILLLLHITAVGLILMGLFHAVGKERRALFLYY